LPIILEPVQRWLEHAKIYGQLAQVLPKHPVAKGIDIDQDSNIVGLS
jgi:hypothetical protein